MDKQSGERVLYLQEVPKIKASHYRDWSYILERRTHDFFSRARRFIPTLYVFGLPFKVNR
jgi:hypothetical protein